VSSNRDRIELGGLPPCRLITAGMETAVVGPTKWDRVLVADPTAQRARLSEPNMVGIGRASAAEEAWLR
jgi:hypothetical protein